MPNLELRTSQDATGTWGRSAQLPAPPPRRQLALAAALAAAAGGLAAAGAAGWVLWRCRTRGQAFRLANSDSQPLLPAQQHAGDGGKLPADLGAGLRPVRRARLAALLQAGSGAGRGAGIEMVPMMALPAALAHQLPGTEKGAGGSEDLAAGQSGSHTCQPPVSAAGAADVEEQEGQVGAPHSRQWGLNTTSLLLQSEELEVGSAGAACGRRAALLSPRTKHV